MCDSNVCPTPLSCPVAPPHPDQRYLRFYTIKTAMKSFSLTTQLLWDHSDESQFTLKLCLLTGGLPKHVVSSKQSQILLNQHLSFEGPEFTA